MYFRQFTMYDMIFKYWFFKQLLVFKSIVVKKSFTYELLYWVDFDSNVLRMMSKTNLEKFNNKILNVFT